MTEQVQEISQEQAAAATATLAERQTNPDWMSKVTSTTEGWPEKREFAALMAASSKDIAKGGDRLDQIIAGTAKTSIGELTTGGEISTHNAMQSAAWLRDAGLSDPQIKQALAGKPVSRAEYDAIKTLRADRLGNKEWAAKLTGGDSQAHRELLLMSTIIVNGYEGQEWRP